MAKIRLLTTAEVAEYLAVPISTIHRWRYVGTGPPAIRVGRHLRFDPDDLDNWIAEQKNSQPSRQPQRPREA